MFQGFFALAPCFLYHPKGKQKHEDAPAHNRSNTPRQTSTASRPKYPTLLRSSDVSFMIALARYSHYRPAVDVIRLTEHTCKKSLHHYSAVSNRGTP